MLNHLVALTALLLLAGCPQTYAPAPAPAPAPGPAPAPAPGPAPAPAPGPAASPGDGSVAVGGACDVAADCESGKCEGQGCAPGGGVCVERKRICKRDYIERCNCDGNKVGGSSDCLNGRIAGRPPCGDAPKDPEPTAGNRADGEACSFGAECTSGVCEGEGCGENAGLCIPKNRACTMDLRLYCGCDGATFQSSGSCPGRLFAKRGACDA